MVPLNDLSKGLDRRKPSGFDLKAIVPHNGNNVQDFGPSTGQTVYSNQLQWHQNSNNQIDTDNFMSRGFNGFVDFTKTGMSLGEKFTYGLYDKFSKWSRSWFTHLFLVGVVALYSAGGALLFGAIEGRQSRKDALDTHIAQKDFFKAIRTIAEDHELRKYNENEFDGTIVYILRAHHSAVQSLLNHNQSLAELEEKGNTDPWSFWNAMFFCGTIYTTIGRRIFCSAIFSEIWCNGLDRKFNSYKLFS